MHFSALAVAAALTGSVAGHMFIVEPAPLRYSKNPHVDSGKADYSLASPLSGMAQYPCKGALADLGTPAGASVATYAPGGSYQMTMGTGGAVHGGGSCQISLSYDQGKTFKVIKSIEGGCPAAGASYKFTIPSDAPAGPAVFSWSWNNKIGNREFYQNCASVEIGGGAQKRAEIVPRATAFASLPDIFVSNLGGEYCTPESIDLIYPNPGPDVERNTNSPGNAKICATGAEVPAGSAGGAPPSGGNTGGSPPSGGNNGGNAGDAPSASAPAAAPTTAPAAQPSTTAASVPGGVFVTVPAGGAGGASSAPAASPTTLQTQTSSAAAAPSAPAAGTSAPAQPAPVPTSAAPSGPAVPAPSGAPGAGAGSGSGLTGACTDEGAWNCIGGSSFQRCASGTWSAVIPMAAGTSCQSGVASTLSTKRDAGALRRRRIGWF